MPLQDDPVTNLNNAFEVAEKYLDIPKMLDAEGEYLPCVQSTPCFLGPYLSGPSFRWVPQLIKASRKPWKASWLS